jgi:hypothetical protein
MHALKCVHKMTLALILATVIATPGFARTDASTTESPPGSPSLPPVQSQGQTDFMTGGIGLDESEAIKKEGSSWPLMLELAQSGKAHAEYLSDVQITIRDKAGNTVLDVISEGPFVLAKLPPGKYSLDATYESATLHRELNLQKGKNKQILLFWSGLKNNP